MTDKATQEEIDRRYAEKVKARAEGRAAVFVTLPVLPTGISKAEINARYLAKLANHGKPQALVAPVVEAEAEPKADKPKAPAAAGDKAQAPKADKPKA
jgi:hypothetical protein